MNDIDIEYKIREESKSRLPEYSEIPIWFEVRSIFEIEGDDPQSALLVEKPIESPWIKD